MVDNPNPSGTFLKNDHKYVLAPMVDQSELAWRMLARKYGAHVTFTPMIHIGMFMKDKKYRKKAIDFSDNDRPCIAQFCGNSPELFASAAQIVEPYCDGIDLNLGCPQGIARRGHYGSFLQDEWDLIASMVRTCKAAVKVPVSVKIRVFPEVERTVAYAKMLEEAGANLITVHGRTREQNGQATGLADWNKIKAIKKAVKVPVIANGNILSLDDANRCMKETGCDAVMSAEPHLYDPTIFWSTQVDIYQVAREYMYLVHEYPCPTSFVRGHLFKLFRNALNDHTEMRVYLASAKTIEDIEAFISELQNICEKNCMQKEWNSALEPRSIQSPHWICQAYLRPLNQTTDKSTDEAVKCDHEN